MLVRDCGSYHGTIVNGGVVGGDDAVLTAQLRAGENEIVAGNTGSPFRFLLTISRD